jgi:hypothetical protein
MLATVAIVATVTTIVVLRLQHSHSGPSGPPCWVTTGTVGYGLDLEQAANATTIASVGKRLSMPDHAITIALAAALQESGLHNLDYGDLDSLGLFQQRPSQGWGTPAQIMTPSYAAAAFYRRLTLVPGWQTLSVTDAAQRVQRSAAPNAYAEWEQQARAFAVAMTGEAPAGMTCRANVSTHAPLDPAYVAAMTTEVGVSDAATVTSPARGWTLATWLVGHATRYHIHSVAFAGQTWTGATAAWRPFSGRGAGVVIS